MTPRGGLGSRGYPGSRDHLQVSPLTPKPLAPDESSGGSWQDSTSAEDVGYTVYGKEYRVTAIEYMLYSLGVGIGWIGWQMAE